MELSEVAQELLDGLNSGVLATINPDGGPQTSVVWVGRDGDEVVISTTAGMRKDTNLRRNPQASLLVLDKDDSARYVEIRGTATVTEDVGRAVAVQLAEKYEGPGAGQGYLELPPEAIRTVIRITPDKVRVRA
ncbi:PPOX class F420-dependent oxidoreductase [Kribbella qitaiheensis]|uniref:PPOX class F420-dependent oxidoreductase n=1 Tax=Kribbella qitaiheensis TaxID=1544730 RepID=A0A7G6X378_9ACTN|nr:PPOX class F420-dependent oxidoreductase [Kribbella qitaiheensis]QNE20693.1 PPOX class F420-dependent oxidoreductase [Kribbella qitaiheensis]